MDSVDVSVDWLTSKNLDIVPHAELITIVSPPRASNFVLTWRDLQVHWRVLLMIPGQFGAKVNWPFERQLIIDWADTRPFYLP
jgi:hypothetical protein